MAEKITLASAIASFNGAVAEYNANCPQGNQDEADAFAAATFKPWVNVLENWSRPATTHAEAVAALRVALKEAEEYHCSEPVAPMIRAALAYLEGADRDAHLIELGRQFEAAKAAAVPLDRKRKASIARRERAYADAGIPYRVSDWEPAHRKLADKIDRQSGTDAAYEAFSAKHNVCIRLMRAIHKAKATTLEGFAVKAAAAAFDQADFDVDVPVPSDVADRELYRLARDMAKAVKGGRNG